MAGKLTSAHLTRLQAVATSAMDVPGIQIKHDTPTNDGYGLQSVVESTTSTVTGGWAKPTARIMQVYAGLIGSLAAWVVRLPYGTSCARNDRLFMPSGEVLVMQADLSQSSYSTCKLVLATAIR